jgi:hypothetical protein
MLRNQDDIKAELRMLGEKLYPCITVFTTKIPAVKYDLTLIYDYKRLPLLANHMALKSIGHKSFGSKLRVVPILYMSLPLFHIALINREIGNQTPTTLKTAHNIPGA